MVHLQPVSSDDQSSENGCRLAGRVLRRSARGDEQAFAALYDATSARVHGLVLRVIRDPAQAEEVTQEVFLQVWRTAARYDESKGSALAWLMTLAHRRAVDRVRAAEAVNRQDTSYHQNSQTLPMTARLKQPRPPWKPDGSDRPCRTHSVQREALELAYFGGYTHTEVATMLDLPVGTEKPASGMGSSGCATRWEWANDSSRDSRSGRGLLGGRTRRRRARTLRGPPGRLRRVRAEVLSLQDATLLLSDLTSVAPPAAMRDKILADIKKVRPVPPAVARIEVASSSVRAAGPTSSLLRPGSAGRRSRR